MEVDFSYIFVISFCLVCIIFMIGSSFIKSKKVYWIIGVSLVAVGVIALAGHIIFLRA